MPKRIISKSDKWPGSVVLADPLTLPQVEALEAEFDYKPDLPEGAQVWHTVVDKRLIPVILQVTEKFDLEHFPQTPTLETWPLTPRKDSHLFILWLWEEIIKVYNGAQEVPNE